MDLVFSPGWLYLFLAIMILCVWRIIVKARTINQESRRDARVFHIAPFTPDKREPVAGSHGSDSDALRKAEEALHASLRKHPAEPDPEGRARILLNLGRLYRDLAIHGERRVYLIKAAQAYYEGTALPVSEESDLAVPLLAGLGDTYQELSAVYEEQECLGRAMQAYALAIKAGTGADPARYAALCESYSQAAMSLGAIIDGEENRNRAAKALKAGLAALDENEHPDQHRRLRERLVELELG